MGDRINGLKVVEHFFDREDQICILKLEGQESEVTMTFNSMASLYFSYIDVGYGYGENLENQKVNGCEVVNKTFVDKEVTNKAYVENGPCFILNLRGQVEPVIISKDLVESFMEAWSLFNGKVATPDEF